jgi:hypothetical protein
LASRYVENVSNFGCTWADYPSSKIEKLKKDNKSIVQEESHDKDNKLIVQEEFYDISEEI